MNRNTRNDDRKSANRDQDKPRSESPREREKSINGGHQGSTGQRDKHDR